jgi:hypothetical protein
VVVHAFNPSTWEAEAGTVLSSRPAWFIEWVLGQPGLYRETLSRKTKNIFLLIYFWIFFYEQCIFIIFISPSHIIPLPCSLFPNSWSLLKVLLLHVHTHTHTHTHRVHLLLLLYICIQGRLLGNGHPGQELVNEENEILALLVTIDHL